MLSSLLLLILFELLLLMLLELLLYMPLFREDLPPLLLLLRLSLLRFLEPLLYMPLFCEDLPPLLLLLRLSLLRFLEPLLYMPLFCEDLPPLPRPDPFRPVRSSRHTDNDDGLLLGLILVALAAEYERRQPRLGVATCLNWRSDGGMGANLSSGGGARRFCCSRNESRSLLHPSAKVLQLLLLLGKFVLFLVRDALFPVFRRTGRGGDLDELEVPVFRLCDMA